jgi:hypothetical protein
MTAYPATPTAPGRRRLLALYAFLAAALAATVGLLTHPAIARADYDADYYVFCLYSIGQGPAYCCAQAGGVLNSGSCLDPANLRSPTTITQRVQPPIIVVPTAP